QAFLKVRADRLATPLVVGQHSRRIESPGACPSGVLETASCQHCLQPSAPLAPMAALKPEPAQGGRHAQAALAALDRIRFSGGGKAPGERCPQVVMLGLKSIQPRSLIGASQRRLGLLGESQEEAGVLVPDPRLLAAVREALAGIFPDR